MPQKFHVFVGGDPSVGLQNVHLIVTFDDPFFWDEDTRARGRAKLAELYEVPIDSVTPYEEYLLELRKQGEIEQKLFPSE